MQRYELQLGLPIRRPAGKERGFVVATTAELDAWIHASPVKESLVLRRKPPEAGAALETLRAFIAEHHRLREEMTRARTEMHDAMELLREGIVKITAVKYEMLPEKKERIVN